MSSLVAPCRGSLEATGGSRLVDAAGGVVGSVAGYLRDLQAAGRSSATQRSYGMDLLRWFRFLWAIDVGWDRATQVEHGISAAGSRSATRPSARIGGGPVRIERAAFRLLLGRRRPAVSGGPASRTR